MGMHITHCVLGVWEFIKGKDTWPSYFWRLKKGKGEESTQILKFTCVPITQKGDLVWDWLTWVEQGPIESGQLFISCLCTFSAFMYDISWWLSNLCYHRRRSHLCYGPKPNQNSNSTLSEIDYSKWYLCYLNWCWNNQLESLAHDFPQQALKTNNILLIKEVPKWFLFNQGSWLTLVNSKSALINPSNAWVWASFCPLVGLLSSFPEMIIDFEGHLEVNVKTI